MPVSDNRNVLRLIVLSLLTCGLYGIWFMFRWIRDINVICQDDGKHTTGLFLTLLLSLCTLGIYGLCWWYMMGNRLLQYSLSQGIPCGITGKKLLLLQILGCFCCGLSSLYALHLALTTTNHLGRYHNATR